MKYITKCIFKRNYVQEILQDIQDRVFQETPAGPEIDWIKLSPEDPGKIGSGVHSDQEPQPTVNCQAEIHNGMASMQMRY